jgi:enoyl-CoA hydratase
LFGESLDGEEAAQRGLAWRCVAEDELSPVVLDYASRAAKLDRPLAQRARTTLDDSAGVHRASDAIELELPVQQWSMERPEFLAALGRLRARLGRST